MLLSRVLDGRTLFESNPATLAVRPPVARDVTAFATASGVLLVRWTPLAYTGAQTARLYLDGGSGETLVGTAPAQSGRFVLDGLDPAVDYTVRVEMVDGSGGAVGSVSAAGRAAVPDGIQAVSQFDPDRAGGYTYGDVWGYTAPDGTEYALLTGRGAGLSVIDITDAPLGPAVEVGFLAQAPGASDSKDVKVYGRHAYLVNERGPIQIIDLADPATPVQVGTLDTQPGVEAGGAHNVAVFDGHLWVTGGRMTVNAGVRAYDVRTTPEAPAFVGEFQPDHFARPYYHDFEVRGTYGFGPSISGDGVDILDVSDPANIRLVNTVVYPGSGAHNTCTSEDGSTLYVGDEVGSSGNWTRVFDISDVGDPELETELIVDPQAVVHNCYTKGDRLYVAHYTEGMRIYDIADPKAPVEVAFYDTYRPTGYGYAGAWTVYPYFSSGKLIVSDMQSGLFVIVPDGVQVADEPRAAPGRPRLALAPNPARGRATLDLGLDAPADVRLSVFDVRGREVRVLLDRSVAGDQRVDLDTSTLAPGAYVVRLVVEGRAPVTRVLSVVR